ncbi:RNA polymerase recycling motor ATPase HelR [Microbacterium sp. CJ88]|uniref:RNA polymerase recycling motor ATPase HelR n=1 Tax=Microbacterium sp. CJ88 TaxID=3445672 RepID=UPI003F655668
MSAFALPARLSAKTDPALIAADERHFARIARALARTIADLTARLESERLRAGGSGQAAMDRDIEIHRLSARLRALRRFRLDACLGRMVGIPTEDDPDPAPRYIGRFGLTDDTDGARLLIDWRAPAAEPFFGATLADPMGIASRRRYRWSGDRVTDYWDEAFTEAGLAHGAGAGAALDDQSAFIASLGSSRSPRMRDVLSTIQSDQDAIIRADSRGVLVVDGGPGTGKTVVALHRAAYLLYADSRLQQGAGRVLFVGPHRPYLAYVGDVLPSLGEEGVLTCTVANLVAEGADAAPEPSPEVARLKASAALVDAIEPAVALYEEPPTGTTVVSTPWSQVEVTPQEWADVFAMRDPGATHNEAREQIWDELVELLLAKQDEDVDASETQLRRAFARDEELTGTFQRAWPLLEAAVVVADLWSVPAYLRRCAPSLTPGEVVALQRDDPRAWTTSDLPLLDAARQRIGDPQASRRRAARQAALATDRERKADLIADLIASDDSEMGVMSILRGADAQNSLDDEEAVGDGIPLPDPDLLAGPFAHVIVDEAQELTDAQWRMLLRRCPSRSFTIVGDRAQARHGFTESWDDRLARAGLGSVRTATLTVNYRTPSEVMAAAEPVIRAALPDANVPTSVRDSGVPVRSGAMAELDTIVEEWLAAHGEGVACVIGDIDRADAPRVRSLTPELAKGLEFDLVVLVRPDAWGTGIEGAVDRYVAMTRATQQLVVLR